jgi:uncharacterized membrane protein HdeD (DUF308 family)
MPLYVKRLREGAVGINPAQVRCSMRKSILELGIVMGSVGIGALLLPKVFPVVSSLYIGTLLILGGLLYLACWVMAYSKERWMVGLLCWTYLLVGGVLLFNPNFGIHATKVFLIVFFFTDGNLKFILSTKLVKICPVWPPAFGGAVSFILFGLLWIGWPDSSLKTQERFVGLHFIVTGCMWILVGLINSAGSRKSNKPMERIERGVA